jgi:hypothetical protein
MTFNVTTKTPPVIKWLLVERATLVGDIAQRANNHIQCKFLIFEEIEQNC